MKLVIAGTYPFNQNKITGGVEAYLCNLLEGFQQINVDDLEIHAISCTTDITKEKVVKNRNLTIHYLPSARRLRNITLYALDRYKITNKVKSLKPDLINTHNQTSYSYSSLGAGYPTIMTVHGIQYKETKIRKGLLNAIRRFPINYVERVCLKEASSIICDAPYVKQSIKNYSSARIDIVEPPISREYFDVEHNDIPGRLLFVGGISRRKNLCVLFKAVNILRKNLSGIELRVVGETRESDYLKMLKEYVRNNKLEKNITFLGNIEEELLLREYSDCSLVILPSIEESAGMVIQQAMAAGKAVVASKVGGISNFVEHGQTGFLVECGDVIGLAEKMMILLNDCQLKTEFGERAKREAIGRFRTDEIAKNTYKIYQGAIERGK